VLEFLAKLIANLIVLFLLLPVCLAVATPVILLTAPFRPGHIRSDYKAVVRWWGDWCFLIP
jgi:hypothetical protein